ncbi:pilus assembly FimT family protein [Campylobacter gastrosuis]|uniref:Prepilin-type N-terminal cleavage/methylation domain-containing protein n=1 Tax=Campylobacter gastrosuis TaxID=2974576 RepID=A0ABT7HQY1_9BACT|nr:prepilin-type N-terminal cleavage/methylation domain-containing protein [Campylobacter gastrosuis]MDL0089263.1 prepilin-type N-terminal cleavage/methylation domain-containing protein [Campylobacter gastrosuis]
MKRAFSMIELILVIVVIAILAVIAMPKQNRDPLREAADQIISHIRYTQHLAMQDSKFEVECTGNPQVCRPKDGFYKDYWRIYFDNAAVNGESKNYWRYSIFHSKKALPDNLTFGAEFAIDPADPSKFLTSGISSVSVPKSQRNSRLNIGKAYGVTGMDFSGCFTHKTITFDNIGRPYYSFFAAGAGIPDAKRPYERLMKQACKIKLTGGTGSLTIAVFAETGYACIVTNPNANDKNLKCEAI